VAIAPSAPVRGCPDALRRSAIVIRRRRRWRRRSGCAGNRAEGTAGCRTDRRAGTSASCCTNRGTGAGAEQATAESSLARIIRVRTGRQAQQQRNGTWRNQRFSHSFPRFPSRPRAETGPSSTAEQTHRFRRLPSGTSANRSRELAAMPPALRDGRELFALDDGSSRVVRHRTVTVHSLSACVS
jgi:hypothetical protein